MTDSLPLEQVLADARGEAQLLRTHGHAAQADSIERLCEAVAESMRDYLDWLTEDEAQLHSGRGAEWLRHRFAEWEALGMAKREHQGRSQRRRYRLCIVPRRANTAAAYEAGRRGAA